MTSCQKSHSLMSYGKSNCDELWKAHFDGMYREIHSNKLEHIVLMHWRACYSTWWTRCIDLWLTTNNKLLGKQNHASVPFTWKTFVHLNALAFGATTMMWCDKYFQCLGVWMRQNPLNNKALMWLKNNKTIGDKKIKETLETLNKHMHIWTLKHKILKKV